MRCDGSFQKNWHSRLRPAILTAIHVTPGDAHEVNWLNTLIFEPSVFYIMDQGSLHFAQLYSHPVDFTVNVLCDQNGASRWFPCETRLPGKTAVNQRLDVAAVTDIVTINLMANWFADYKKLSCQNTI